MKTIRPKKIIAPTAVAALLLVLFAAMETPAKAPKAKPGRIVRDTVDTVLTPGSDGVTYDEKGGGRASERKVVVTETVVPGKTRDTTVKSTTKPPRKHASHQGSTKAGHKRHYPPAAPRDTVLSDTTQILGTPGSPTGAESRGMPGEKPIPGTK